VTWAQILPLAFVMIAGQTCESSTRLSPLDRRTWQSAPKASGSRFRTPSTASARS